MLRRRAAFKTTTERGAFGEKIAQQHYVKLGFKILSANFYNPIGKRQGEIDFVARKNNTIIFVEVKTRSAENNSNNARQLAYQNAIESITAAKQKKLGQAVRWYLRMYPASSQCAMQIDVCIVLLLDKTAKCVIIVSNAVDELF